MKKTIFPAFSIFTLLIVGCTQPKSDKTQNVDRVVKVTTACVNQKKITTLLRYSGTIEPSQTIPLGFQTTGTVEKVFVSAGDEVRKGQLLATLNESDARSMYQITLSKYEQANDAYNRLKSVYENGSLPEVKWVEMETNLAQAKSSLEISKNSLEKCKLYAPQNGVIGRRNIEPGMSSIMITSSPFELVDINQVFVKISIPENEISKIKKGMNARFSVSALNDQTFSGEISSINPVADEISRTYEVKIKVNNTDKKLMPGMVCDVTLDEVGEKEVILIPYQSVSVDKENNRFVYVIDQTNQIARKNIIKIGQYQESAVEVISGLVPGQIIVVEGKEKLFENCKITK